MTDSRDVKPGAWAKIVGKVSSDLKTGQSANGYNWSRIQLAWPAPSKDDPNKVTKQFFWLEKDAATQAKKLSIGDLIEAKGLLQTSKERDREGFAEFWTLTVKIQTIALLKPASKAPPKNRTEPEISDDDVPF